MQQLVRISHCNEDGTATVFCVRESACSGDCHKCAGCGAVEQKVLFTAQNPIGAVAGDLVSVETQTGPVLLGAAMLYVLPLVLFLIGYILFDALWGLGALGGIIAFALGILCAVAYDRLVVKKQNTQYIITGFGHNSPAEGR